MADDLDRKSKQGKATYKGQLNGAAAGWGGPCDLATVYCNLFVALRDVLVLSGAKLGASTEDPRALSHYVLRGNRWDYFGPFSAVKRVFSPRTGG